MEFTPLALEGTYEITLKPHTDPRGYFVETYRAMHFEERGLVTTWLQENQSYSKDAGVLRGLHFQLPPHTETKLVRALSGVILDVMVDLRTESPTYGQWAAVEVDAQKHNMVYVPKGFAHAFCTLTDDVLVAYKVDAYYAPAAQAGLLWNDPTLAIDWPTDAPVLSEKDAQLPTLAEFDNPF